MVTVAAFADLNNDHYPELIIAGDWMPVMIFNNRQGTFSKSDQGLNNLNGMWSALTATDIDGDGDIDLLLGNCGYNDQFSATSGQPLQMFVNDFDDNGTIDPIICYYIKGKSYPMASRDELLDQIAPLKKKYVHYKDYADATLSSIFSKDKINKASEYYCNQLASGILYNNAGSFTFKPFPLAAQVSKIFSLVVADVTNTGKKDIFCAGNFFPYRVQLGRSDASLGVVLTASADGGFQSVDPNAMGAYVGGDVRAMVQVKNAKGEKVFCDC